MPEIMNLREMARTLRVSMKWLEDQTKAGKVPCLEAGRTFLFNPAAVQRALGERAGNPTGRIPLAAR